MIANILTPVDGSSLSERALPYAASLARATQARLRLLYMRHADPLQRDLPLPGSDITTMVRVELLAAHLREAGVQATAQEVTGLNAGHAILAATHHPPADLIVLSTHGRSGIGRWLYGSVAEQVLRESDVPVLLVSSACHDPWPADRPLKLMVPLDGSKLSEAALGPARMLAHTLGGTLLLVRVADVGLEASWPFAATRLAAHAAPSAALAEARDYLDALAASMEPALHAVDVLVDEGDPASVITSIAKQERADLIVMATHGRTGLLRLTMGSVATTTLQRAHVPLLLIRPIGPAQFLTESEEADSATMADEFWPPVGTLSTR